MEMIWCANGEKKTAEIMKIIGILFCKGDGVSRFVIPFLSVIEIFTHDFTSDM